MSWGNLNNLAMATTNAANPAAEDANPAAVGKLFSDTMCNFHLESWGKLGSVPSISARNFLKSAKHAFVLSDVKLSGFPLSQRISSLYSSDVATEVRVRKSSWDNVTEMDELVGKLRDLSRFPQYLSVCVSKDCNAK